MESAPELSAYELERGKSIPSKNHGKLQFRIAKAIADNVGERFDILTEVSLDLSRPVVPDIALFPAEPSDWLEDEIRMTTPPLCAIEIISPTQGNQELIALRWTFTLRQVFNPAGLLFLRFGSLTFSPPNTTIKRS